MRLALVLLLALLSAPSLAQPTAQAPTATPAAAATPTPADPAGERAIRVLMVTSQGRITLELYPDRAPRTVANFLDYAREGFYNGTIFHRVADNFLIQGGRYTPDFNRKPVREPIPNESGNGLSNLRGTIAAARAPSRADSATSEFFINVVDNPRLDQRGDQADFTSGYAVFGRVVAGLDVVDRIRAVATTTRDPIGYGVPVEPVLIERVDILDGGPISP